MTRRDMVTMRSYLRPALAALVAALPLMISSPARAEGVFPDLPQTSEIGERAHVSKETALGDAYLTGRGVSQDLKQAAYWYEKGAGLGDPVAQNQIGYLYEVGLGVEKDQARAMHWYQLASAGGLTNAKVNLAVAYIWGMGVEKNPPLGESLLLEAVAKGNSMAATYLGDLHFDGIGVPRDEAAGEKWYEKAVKMHNYLGAYRVGMLLSERAGHAHDLKRALGLFRESATAGFVPAMHSLGRLQVNHPELCASHEEALKLLSDAAEAGTWQSSMVLGALARDGKWVAQDDRQAYLRFREGTLQGGDTARALAANDLKVLSAKLSAQERAELDRQAEAWAGEHAQLLSMLYKGKKAGADLGAIALATPPSGSHAGMLLPVGSAAAAETHNR
ncbi:sel1 repeat family protein [Acidobacteria bacterium AB60]|nr:sel1 repeat family protein [Acidobacteria bacterium AB60]